MTFGTTAPVGSETVPVIEAVVVCAEARLVSPIATAATNASCFIFIVFEKPLLLLTSHIQCITKSFV